MEHVVVSPKFQVVIPKAVRRKMGIRPGQEVVFEPEKNDLKLILVPSLAELEGKFPELRRAPGRRELWRDDNK